MQQEACFKLEFLETQIYKKFVNCLPLRVFFYRNQPEIR